MRVLFVASGNSNNYVSPIVKAQAESLTEAGQVVDIFPIIGTGISGYLKAAIKLRNYFKKKEQYDVIHAHYSLSAFTATLAGARPLIVSLMGSDTNQGILLKVLIRFFNRVHWKHCIVKSEAMKDCLKIDNLIVLPNGVDLKIFKPSSKLLSRNQLGWETDKLYILFAANPNRPEKNYRLLEKALMLVKRNVIVKYLIDVPHHTIPQYMNAADVVVLSSLREGSPNVIKEAMACNRPIVATDVGDIKWLFNDLKGCYLSLFSAKDIADNLENALEFSLTEQNTSGRERIIQVGLSSTSVAHKLIELYNRYGNKVN